MNKLVVHGKIEIFKKNCVIVYFNKTILGAERNYCVIRKNWYSLHIFHEYLPVITYK